MRKGSGYVTFMTSDQQNDQLNAIVDRLLERDSSKLQNNLLNQFSAPFDVSRPNIHDSKKEFLRELEAAQAVVKSSLTIIGKLVHSEIETEADHNQMLERLGHVVDLAGYEHRRGRTIETARDLALKNLADTGFFRGSLLVVIEMMMIYRRRLLELKDQKKQYWSVPHRAPNYYARTIALRLARLYAQEKRQRPTFGIARDGNHPSTEFGRALEDVFAVLEIKAAVRGAAEWAIEQLTDDDVNPPLNALRNLGLGGIGLGRLVLPAIESPGEEKAATKEQRR